jgi:peptide chain release factor subunit 1
MLEEIDLKKLSKLSSHDRAFLSMYLRSPESVAAVLKRAGEIHRLLKGNRDEHHQMGENVKLVKDYLDKNRYTSGSLCIFCCWLLDYLEAYPLTVEVEDIVRVDSSPYIRPLAELRDEYENFAVIVADNERARVFLVTAGRAQAEESIRGDIKNHVKVGGWSQQRYERRRDKEFEGYAGDIAQALLRLDETEEFERIVLVGGKEALSEIAKALPDRLAYRLIGEKPLDMKKGEKYVNDEIFDLFREEERRSESQLWQQIRDRFFRGEPAVVGVQDVLYAAQGGRVEKAIVNRKSLFAGARCRDCENLYSGSSGKCPRCGSESTFRVDLLNEIVELLSMTGAEIDFADEIDELTEAGGIAAMLRY